MNAIVSPTLPGVNVLLMGPAGTGKTHCIATLVNTGLEVFFLDLESGLESLLGYYADAKKPIPPNLHWHVLSPPKAGFDEMIESATKINQLSFESIAKMIDPNRTRHNMFIDLLTVMNNFVDQRTGEKFGAVDTWDTTRVIVIDGCAGINLAAMSLVIGSKPVKAVGEWGIAQDTVEKLVRKLTKDTRCHFVLIGHVERETDMVLGGVKITISTLGRALAPKLPPMFSDVILTVRDGNKWTWDTGSSLADVKARNLPFASGLQPDFRQIVEKWKARAAAAQLV